MQSRRSLDAAASGGSPLARLHVGLSPGRIEKETKEMAEPVIVTIPHKLTKEEAVRRLKKGFGDVRSTVGETFMVLTDDWAGDHLDFKASLLGQTTTGTVDVGEHSVRLEIQLPWMLALLANKAKAIVQKKGQLMLEKPSKTTTTTT
jgi:hypothetical protein